MPYAALVLDGAYIETSFDGPLQCRPGTLVLHPAFHAHGDRFGRLGAHAINIDLPAAFDAAGASAWQVHDLREAREVFARCPKRLPELLACARPLEATELPDWQRALVVALPDAQ